MPRVNPRTTVLPCELRPEVTELVHAYGKALRSAAPSIGDHGMSEEEFERSGLFHAAIEHLRGTQAATTKVKYAFIETILDHLKSAEAIREWKYHGAGERYDYSVHLNDGRVAVIEAKGCLDGNNTNIYQHPPDADEFHIWSLCQNPGADPGHNAWSGIHTRLGAEIIHRSDRVDALLIWDMLCGSPLRPCPKLEANPDVATMTKMGAVPPPCVFLFPRTRPDPRNNPEARPWKIEDLGFCSALCEAFDVDDRSITDVTIRTKMKEADLQRRTILTRAGEVIAESRWTTLKRAGR